MFHKYTTYIDIFIAFCIAHLLCLSPDVLSNMFTGCLKHWGHCASWQSHSLGSFIVTPMTRWSNKEKPLWYCLIAGKIYSLMRAGQGSRWQAWLLSITWFALTLSYTSALFNSNDSESIYMTEGLMWPFRLQRHITNGKLAVLVSHMKMVVLKRNILFLQYFTHMKKTVWRVSFILFYSFSIFSLFLQHRVSQESFRYD